MTHSKFRRFLQVCIASFAALSFFSVSELSHADEGQDVSRLIKAGQFDQAMQKADQFLATKPRDPQMRFLKGLIFTELGKTSDAISVFSKLTEDYPELPEPYNNLAVLYASSGQYDKARASLEMAIRTHPSYATAHENLGDVYARLASQAYDKALQLDTGNSAAQSKLALVRELVTGNKKPNAAPTTASPAPAPIVAVVTPPVPSKPITTVKAEPIKVETTKPVAQAPIAVASVAVPNSSLASPSVVGKPVTSVNANVSNDQQEILNRITGWAAAWSDQDVPSYLSHYARTFKTPNGLSRRAWEQERRERIEGKRKIQVTLSSSKIEVDGNTAKVTFRQAYRADALSTNGSKTLLMNKSAGQWYIMEERSGS